MKLRAFVSKQNYRGFDGANLGFEDEDNIAQV